VSGLLDGRVALVSGVGAGVGSTIARTLAAAGADVVLAARSESTLHAVAEDVKGLGRRALVVPADIRDPDASSALVQRAVDDLGRLDVVVNNATAVEPIGPFVATDFAAWRDNFDITVLGSLAVTKAAAPHLAVNGGSVIFTNSMVIRVPVEGLSAYSAAKGALAAAARVLAVELGPSGIRVNSVVPGWIWGDKTAAQIPEAERDTWYRETAERSALRIIPTERHVADSVLFFASDLSAAVTGQTLDVNAGVFFQ
jgi:NAD(P)-dependent dehydrogenase (short-subunit alcohol dehydrogenase family)